MRALLRTALALAVPLAPAGAAEDERPPGSVLLLGHAAPFAAVLPAEAPAGERVWLALEDGPDPFAALGGATLRVDVAVVPGAPRPDAPDRAAAARVRGAALVALDGGTWLGWWHALTPGDFPSRLGQAVLEAHQAGALVLGRGAAAGFLAEHALVDPADFDVPRRNPRASDEHVPAGGLALARGVWLATPRPDRAATADDARTLERLLAAVAATWLDEAWLLPAGGALAWSPRTRHLAVLAGPPAVLLDLSGARVARRPEGGRRLADARLALLAPSATWDLRRGALLGAEPLEAPPEGASTEAAPLGHLSQLADAAGGARRTLALPSGATLELELGRGSARRGRSLSGVRLDLSATAPPR